MEVIKLTEECSAAILNFPEKKKDPRCPTISCSIRIQYFDQALCDLGDSISVMPKAVFDKLNLTQLTPTPMMLQQADSTVRYLAGIAEDVPVKIQDCYVPIHFVVLAMEVAKESTLILGQPFLTNSGAQIDIGAREIHFNIHANEENFAFRPRKEQCSMIRIKYGPNLQGLKEIHIQPQLVDIMLKRTKKSKRSQSKRRLNK
ncbi:uncharacterized protein [Miscanthus floridulus]|uniref:uncharacterized protein n=1 Tax=Miscanthus floridulus TaxID=154761 RepID=UPI00345AA5A0